MGDYMKIVIEDISYHFNTTEDRIDVLYETDEWSLSAAAGSLPEGF